MTQIRLLPNCVPDTTYRTNFTGELSSLPLIKYKTLPCLYPPGSSVPCRKQARDVVTATQRPLLKPRPPKPEGPNVSYVGPRKPLLKSTLSAKDTPTDHTKVFITKFGPMDMSTINKMYTKTRYTTFTQKAADEVSFPMMKVDPPTTTQETKADMVRLHGQRYESAPEQWQDAVLWDRIQTRTATDPRPSSSHKDRLLTKRQTVDLVGAREKKTIRELVKADGLANVFVRKCPGYSGYNPLCPPETDLQRNPRPQDMTSLMTASYGSFPEGVYQNQAFARKGPFSKTVTLTYPFNPFNKVGQEITPFKRETVFKHMEESISAMTDLKTVAV